MRMKVFPISRKEIRKPPSRVAKIVRLFSNLYFLPLRFNEDYTEVKFSLFHLKTLISYLISSAPSFIVMLWYGLQADFVQQYVEKNLAVYEMIDFVFNVFSLGKPLKEIKS